MRWLDPFSGRDPSPGGSEGDQSPRRQWWPRAYGIPRLLFRAAVMVACLVACCVQCVSILDMYLSYPTTVFVYMERMESLETPGITLCNNNRLALSKLKRFNATFGRLWDTLAAEQTGDDVNDTEINLRKQGLVDDTMRTMIETLPVKHFMDIGHSHDEFILDDSFRCAADDNSNGTPCRTFANIITTSQQSGNCFTLFHRSYKKVSSAASIPSGYGRSPFLKGSANESVNLELSERPFGPNEVLRIKINFTRGEYTTLNDPVSGSIIVHDSSIAPAVRLKSLEILPGFFYDLFLTKVTSDLLPAPYITDCMNYAKKYKRFYDTSSGDDESEDSIYKYPLSKDDCIVGCMGLNTVRRCHCWPPELPFVLAAKAKGDLMWCNWDAGDGLNVTLVDNAMTTMFNHCFSAHEDFCNDFCKLDCRNDRYQIMKETKVWPAMERIEHSKNRLELLEDSKCCAIVSIRFWNTEHTIYKYKAKFEPIELMSYLSGLVSMWLGFSALAFFEGTEKLIEQGLMYFWTRTNRGKETDHQMVTSRSRSTKIWQKTQTKLEAIRRASRTSDNRTFSPPQPPPLYSLPGVQYTEYIPEVRYIRPARARRADAN